MFDLIIYGTILATITAGLWSLASALAIAILGDSQQPPTGATHHE